MSAITNIKNDMYWIDKLVEASKGPLVSIPVTEILINTECPTTITIDCWGPEIAQKQYNLYSFIEFYLSLPGALRELNREMIETDDRSLSDIEADYYDKTVDDVLNTYEDPKDYPGLTKVAGFPNHLGGRYG